MDNAVKMTEMTHDLFENNKEEDPGQKELQVKLLTKYFDKLVRSQK